MQKELTVEQKLDILLHALDRIAQGNPKCGRPLAGETSRQIARIALVSVKHTWASRVKANLIQTWWDWLIPPTTQPRNLNQ